MSEKRTIELEVNSNLGTLKQQLKEAKAAVLSLSQEFGHTSIEATNAANKAAELKLEIAEGNKLIKAFNPANSLNSATTAMGGVKETIGLVGTSFELLGAESEGAAIAMEKVGLAMEFTGGISSLHESAASFKTLGAVIKATSLYQGIYNFVQFGTFKSTVLATEAKVADTAATVAQGTAVVATTAATSTATTATKLLRLALISTGIGAVVVAVGLLIANFDKVTGAIMGAYDKFNKLGPAVKLVVLAIIPFGPLIYGIIKALEYFGVVDDETTRKNKANAEARTKAVEKEANRAAALAKKKQKDDDDKYTHEINLAKASGKDVYEMELKKAKAHVASGKIFLAEQNKKIKAYKDEIEMLIATGDADSDRVKGLKKALTTAKALATESYKDNVATNKAIEVMEVEHQTELANKKKDAGSKAKEKRDELAAQELKDLEAKLEKEKALIEEMRIGRLSAENKELDALNLAYKAKIDIAKGMGEKGLELVKELETNQGIEAAKIRKKYSDLSAEEQQKLYEEKKQQAKTINDLILSDEELAIIAISQKRIDAEKALLKLLEDKKIDNAQYNAGMLKAGKEQEDALLKIKTDSLKVFEDLMTTEREKEILAINEKNDAEFLILEDNLAKKLITQEEFETARKALAIKTSEEIAELDNKDLEKKRERTAKGLQMSLSALSVLNDVVQMNAGKSEKAQRKAFKAQKAFNLASAVVNTYLAVTGALTAGGNPIKLATGMQFVEAGIAAAAGAVQIAKIAGTQFEGGTPPTDTSIQAPTGGAPQAPQFNVVGNNGMNQLAQLQQQPIQAYVVSSEMTSAQALERNRINNATI